MAGWASWACNRIVGNSEEAKGLVSLPLEDQQAGAHAGGMLCASFYFLMYLNLQ